jgi:hypothetical protein
VRDYFADNAAYWIDEFQLDGLRLDATQSIHDRSRRHIIAELGCRARSAARGRPILLIAESETQTMKLIRPIDAGGDGLDGVWNDDFHQRDRRADGQARGVLLGLSRHAAGADLGRPAGVSVSGAALCVAETAPRNAHRRRTCAGICYLPREPRSDCEFGGRLARPVSDLAGPVRRPDGAHAADAGNADVVSGAGIRGELAIPVLCRPTTRSWRRPSRRGAPSL